MCMKNIESYFQGDTLPDSDRFIRYTHNKFNYASAKDLSRSFRIVLSRFGRIIHRGDGKGLIIMDRAKKIKAMVDMIEKIDTKDIKNYQDKVNFFNDQISNISTVKVNWTEHLKDNNVLFIALFSLCFL